MRSSCIYPMTKEYNSVAYSGYAFYINYMYRLCSQQQINSFKVPDQNTMVRCLTPKQSA